MTKVEAVERENARLRTALETLQDAISPSRKGMVDDDYYVKVATRMRQREVEIRPLTHPCAIAEGAAYRRRNQRKETTEK